MSTLLFVPWMMMLVAFFYSALKHKDKPIGKGMIAITIAWAVLFAIYTFIIYE